MNSSYFQRIKQKMQYLIRYAYISPQKNIVTLYKTWFYVIMDLFPWKKGRVVTHILNNGTRFLIRLHSFDMIILNEIYILNLYLPFTSLIKKGDVIDIGAHIGIFSVFAVHTFKPHRVLAFEPYTPNFSLLKKNIEYNKLTSIILPIKLAVGERNGKGNLFIDEKNTGGHSLHTNLLSKSEHKEIISITTLDNIFTTHSIKNCSILKLDCEGAEYDILKAASDETLKKIQLIILEYHPNYSLEKLQSFLKNKGFIISPGRSGFPILFAIKR
ncbi:MAG: FkbM family methyltransferase [Patescibacteria group bacterium]|nr:MAG: FkbM family methyltransferase [Patescibacteria group bacterium]